MKGSLTVETSLIIPLFLSVFIVSIYALFFYHDKAFLGAVTYDTVVYGSGREQRDAEEIEAYFQRQVGNRMLFFRYVTANVEIEDNVVKITCHGAKQGTELTIERKMSRTNPEKKIRNIRKIIKIQEGLGDKS